MGYQRRRAVGVFAVSALVAVGSYVGAATGSASGPASATTDPGSGTTAGSDGAEPGGGEGQTIRILVSAPLSGDYAEDGNNLVRGAEFAAELVNASGGIGAGPMQGAMIEIESADDEVSTEAAATIASRYVDDDGIWALICCYSSGQAQAAAVVAGREGLPVYSGFACADFLTTEADNVLIGCTRLQSLGAAALDFAVTELSPTSISLLSPDFSFEEDIIEGINGRADELGVTVEAQTYPYDQADFSALLTNVEQQNSDVLLETDFQANAGRIISQMREAGLETPVVDALCEGWTNTFYEVVGDAAQGAFGCETTPRSAEEGTFAADVLTRWEEQEGGLMPPPAVYNFDMVMAIVANIEAGASSRDDLLGLIPEIGNGLPVVSGGEGLLGPVEFEDFRPHERPLFMVEVNGTSREEATIVASYNLFADGTIERLE